MKEVIDYAIEQKVDSINLFSSVYNLAILYYQINYMDSAGLTFARCLDIAKQTDNHYFYYKTYLGYNRVNSFLGKYDSATYYTELGLKHSLAINY